MQIQGRRGKPSEYSAVYLLFASRSRDSKGRKDRGAGCNRAREKETRTRVTEIS